MYCAFCDSGGSDLNTERQPLELGWTLGGALVLVC